MSQLIAHELQQKETIEIYDPTSGSGSLLIHIGEAIAQYTERQGQCYLLCPRTESQYLQPDSYESDHARY